MWRLALLSKGEMRTSRWTPHSVLSHPKARNPLTRTVHDLIPASSPALSSIHSSLYLCASAHLAYMRWSISAQSCASVPPAPAWISKKQSLPSASPLKRLSIWRRRASFCNAIRLSSASRTRPSSFSSSARASKSTASLKRDSKASNLPSDAAKVSRLRIISWALAGSFQRSGSSAFVFRSTRRACETSQSKMPPQQGKTLSGGINTLNHFCFHGDLLKKLKGWGLNTSPRCLRRFLWGYGYPQNYQGRPDLWKVDHPHRRAARLQGRLGHKTNRLCLQKRAKGCLLPWG